MGTIKKIGCVWLLVWMVSLPWVCGADPGPLGALFAPLADLDVPAMYSRYQAVIDLGIYLLVFVSVAQFTLGRHFGGREGKAIGVVAGITLAVALSLTQRQLSFELRALGPLAAGMFVLLLAVALFRLVRTLGGGYAASGSLAFIVSYFAIRSVVPGLFEWAQRHAWANALHGLLVLAVLVAFFRIGIDLLGRAEWKLPQIRPRSKDLLPGYERQEPQAPALRKRLARIERQEEKDSQKIRQELSAVQDAIQRYGHQPEAGAFMVEKVRQIMPQRHTVRVHLEQLKKAHARLMKGDLRVFAALKQRYEQLPKEARTRVRKELREVKQTLISEKELQELEGAIERYDHAFPEALEAAVQRLEAGDPSGASEALSRAIACEKQAQELFHRIGKIEKRLTRQAGRILDKRHKV